MKKLFVAFAVLSLLLLAACGGGAGAPDIPLPEGAVPEAEINVYLDGAPLNEEALTYDKLIDGMSEIAVGDASYLGVSVADLAGQDVSGCAGAFLEASDGYVCWVEGTDLTLAAYVKEGDAYNFITLDDVNSFGLASAGGDLLCGVTNIYLVTTAPDFAVDIQVNGESKATLTLADFMKKTKVGENKVPTAMFDGSFKYNSGSSTYEGRFLGVDYETMLAKLDGLDGVDFEGEIKEVEYYGTPGNGEPGKNTEYSTRAGDEKAFDSVDFFCMYDGMTINPEIKDIPVGLAVFVNGTGSRWLTYSLSAINIVTE